MCAMYVVRSVACNEDDEDDEARDETEGRKRACALRALSLPSSSIVRSSVGRQSPPHRGAHGPRQQKGIITPDVSLLSGFSHHHQRAPTTQHTGLRCCRRSRAVKRASREMRRRVVFSTTTRCRSPFSVEKRSSPVLSRCGREREREIDHSWTRKRGRRLGRPRAVKHGSGLSLAQPEGWGEERV